MSVNIYDPNQVENDGLTPIAGISDSSKYVWKISALPTPTAALEGTKYVLLGTQTGYTKGCMYECTEVTPATDPKTYEWTAITGTASVKNATDKVEPGNHDLVESNAVSSAIAQAISTVFTPHGNLACAELLPALLVAANVGNLYNMTDSGTTTSDFVGGAGQTINVGDTVGIITTGPSEYKFNLMPGLEDLSQYANVFYGYLNPTDGLFYKEDTYTTEIPGKADALFVDVVSWIPYAYDETNLAYVAVGGTGDFLETVDELPSVTSVAVGKQYFLSADTTTGKKGHIYENDGTKWVDITSSSKYKSISLLTMTGAKYQCITGLKLSGAYLIEIQYNLFIVRVLNNFGNQSQKKYGFEIELLGQNLNDTTNAFYNYPVYFNNFEDNALAPILAVYVSNGDRVKIQVTQISGAENNDFDFGTFYTSTPPAPFQKSTFYSAASMREAIAPLFNDNKSYNVGDIIWKRVNTNAYDSRVHDNIELYRCIVAHSGSWNSTHFEKIQLCKDFKPGSKIFPGTLDEWEALTEAEQAEYDFVASPEEDRSESNKYFYQTGTVTIQTTVGQTTMENIQLPTPMPDDDYCIDVQIKGGFPEYCQLHAMHTSNNGFRIYVQNNGLADYSQTIKWQVYRIPH